MRTVRRYVARFGNGSIRSRTSQRYEPFTHCWEVRLPYKWRDDPVKEAVHYGFATSETNAKKAMKRYAKFGPWSFGQIVKAEQVSA